MTAIPRAKVRQRLTAFPFSSPALRRRQSKAPVHSAVRSGNHGGRNDGPLPGREHPGRQGQARSKVAAPWCSRPRSMLSPAITYNAKSVCGSRAAGRPPKEKGNVRTWESRICRMSVHNAAQLRRHASAQSDRGDLGGRSMRSKHRPNRFSGGVRAMLVATTIGTEVAS